jgi:hypothetical protein
MQIVVNLRNRPVAKRLANAIALGANSPEYYTVTVSAEMKVLGAGQLLSNYRSPQLASGDGVYAFYALLMLNAFRRRRL